MAVTGFTHTLGVTYKNDAGTITSTTDTFNADAEANLDITVAAGATNLEADITFDPTKAQSLVLFSDKDLTLKVNSTSSPAETIALAAGKQQVWNINSSYANPFGATAVTKFYLTNAGSTAANFKFRCLLNL
jgi:hypothetical protein